MTMLDTFPPTRQAALARVTAVSPGDYARSRNAIEGAVTGLSPYITHGLISLPEVLAVVIAKHPLDVQHKFVFELGWREYFRHVWAFRGEAIFESLRSDLRRVPLSYLTNHMGTSPTTATRSIRRRLG
jgi:deoxyribodipyrimidine photo-lyase